jgi:putative transposase
MRKTVTKSASALRTYQFRVKDATHRNWLGAKARAVNFVWNYCNETSEKAWRRDGRWLSSYELQKLTAYSSAALGLHGHSIQEVCARFTTARDRAKRCRIAWRSTRRSLGWIPFKNQRTTIFGDSAIFMGRAVPFWKSREIEGKFKCGSFSQDARGRWYVNIVCEVPVKQVPSGMSVVGIDLGFKDQAVCSDGTTFSRENLTKSHEDKLAKAQRARKKRQVTAIHAKIANKRKDWAHKTSTAIARKYQQIFVGDVSSTRMIKRGFAKSTHDAGWYMLKTMLAYKAIALGRGFRVVDEKFSTVTCSACSARCGPSGLGGLGVRQWECSECGNQHQRDVNAARNILRAGLGHETPKGVPDV